MVSSKVLRYHDGRSKQVGFVQMASHEEAVEACSLHTMEVGLTCLLPLVVKKTCLAFLRLLIFLGVWISGVSGIPDEGLPLS